MFAERGNQEDYEFEAIERKQKTLNTKHGLRRFTHKMTLGDTDSEVFEAQYDPSDKYLACGFGDGAVRVYNTQTGNCAFTLCDNMSATGQSDEMPVTALKWRPPGAASKT